MVKFKLGTFCWLGNPIKRAGGDSIILAMFRGDSIILAMFSATRKKLPNVYKSCPKMISLEKMIDFDTFTKVA